MDAVVKLPKPAIALTFDDGPNDVHTLHLLDVLATCGVKATFFLIGKLVNKHPAIVRRIHTEGHAIGNHTFTHKLPLEGATREQVLRELSDCKKAIEETTGRPAGPLFRPPWGRLDTTALYAAGEMGLIAVHWSVEGNDWNNNPRHENIVKLIAGLIDSRKQDEIVLLHDGSPESPPADRSQSIIAAKVLIGKYRAENRRFVSLPELISLRYSRE
jgi:peptidoglycan/xylan/chitin deacetylase (PgdA/CDA1 family)